jgi:hypothetical protein
MNTRSTLVAAALLTAAAVPASGQTAGLAAGPANGGAQSAATIPDLSGLWARPYLGFELPLSGPGPVVNKSRQGQILDADGRPLPAATAPLVGTFRQLVGDYTNPILKPWAAAIVKKQGELELSGLQMRSARNQCWPEGVPAVFLISEFRYFNSPRRLLSFMTSIMSSVRCV